MMVCASPKIFGGYTNVSKYLKHSKHSNICQSNKKEVVYSGALVQIMLVLSVLMGVKKTRPKNVLTPSFFCIRYVKIQGSFLAKRFQNGTLLGKGTAKLESISGHKQEVGVNSDNMTVLCMHNDAALWSIEVKVRLFNFHCLKISNLQMYSNVSTESEVFE